MYYLGVIEESLESQEVLEYMKPFLFSQRVDEVPEDEYPLWHVNEYHLKENDLHDLLPNLEKLIKNTWYIHAFNEENLFVILRGKSFKISKRKDNSWNEMIEYGEKYAQVERSYLESIPLHI